jgi:hypothetical protein
MMPAAGSEHPAQPRVPKVVGRNDGLGGGEAGGG